MMKYFTFLFAALFFLNYNNLVFADQNTNTNALDTEKINTLGIKTNDFLSIMQDHGYTLFKSYSPLDNTIKLDGYNPNVYVYAYKDDNNSNLIQGISIFVALNGDSQNKNKETIYFQPLNTIYTRIVRSSLDILSCHTDSKFLENGFTCKTKNHSYIVEYTVRSNSFLNSIQNLFGLPSDKHLEISIHPYY